MTRSPKAHFFKKCAFFIRRIKPPERFALGRGLRLFTFAIFAKIAVSAFCFRESKNRDSRKKNRHQNVRDAHFSDTSSRTIQS